MFSPGLDQGWLSGNEIVRGSGVVVSEASGLLNVAGPSGILRKDQGVFVCALL